MNDINVLNLEQELRFRGLVEANVHNGALWRLLIGTTKKLTTDSSRGECRTLQESPSADKMAASAPPHRKKLSLEVIIIVIIIYMNCSNH